MRAGWTFIPANRGGTAGNVLVLGHMSVACAIFLFYGGNEDDNGKSSIISQTPGIRFPGL